MKQANLATKPDIADFVKETDFNNKLKKLNKKITSNKTKHSLELNELSEKVKILLTKILAKNLINIYQFINGAKYFTSGI